MKLETVVPWGRSLAEYQAMFALSDQDLTRNILGIGDGPASFNTEMTAMGRSVTSIDPVYQFTTDQIEARVRATYDTILDQVKANLDRYNWSTMGDADRLGQLRLEAMNQFLADYELGKSVGRYQAQSLPKLEFADRQFDLCLCSHLLFLYSEQLSLEFHINSVIELLRVAPEVRIFPLLTLDCQVSPYLQPTIEQLERSGIVTEIQTVDYEFQKGGNQQLICRAADG
jgi:hypothetical protein